MRAPKVTITFPVIGKDKFLVSCLKSIDALDYPQEKLEIILVDNGLDDNIKYQISNSKNIRWIQNKKNVGFARAINQGIRKGQSDLFLITNSDVVLDKNCLKNLMEVALGGSRIGILGPRVYSLEKPKEVSKQDLPGFKTDFFWGQPRSLATEKLKNLKTPIEVDWVSGSALLIKRKVVEKIGLFDERFFAYWEEADFCTRARKAGFKVVLIPKAKIYHQGSVVLGKETSQKTYYLVRNNLLFLFKHTSFMGKMRLHLRNLSLVLVKLLAASLGMRREHNLAFIAGIADFYRARFGERGTRYNEF